MTTLIERAHLLKSLHIKGDPLILFNIWDAGSALAIKECGSKVIATSSYSVAKTHGYADGESLPFDLVLANLKRITAIIDLPVTIDIESGYARLPIDVQKNTLQLIEAGAAGINFEDQMIGSDLLYSVEEQCARIRGIREAAKQTGIPIFINARTDIFFKSGSVAHNTQQLDEAIYRATAYAESGADGFFVPGLKDTKCIEKLCAVSPIPINIMTTLDSTITSKQFAKLGVARISYGPFPYLQMIDALKEAGRFALL